MRPSLNLLKSLARRWPLKDHPTKAFSSAAFSTQASRNVIKENFEVVSPFPSVGPGEKDICSLILESARKWSHLTAVECGITGISYTYGELLDRSLRWGSHLQSQGIGKGDTVAIFMPNCPSYAIAYVGTMASGASFTLVNSTFTANEVSYQLVDSRSKVIIVHPLMEGIVMKAISGLQNPPKVYVAGPSSSGNPNFLEISEDNNVPFVDFKEFARNDICCLQYSSGTTGLPKGAIFTHGGVGDQNPMVHQPHFYANRRTTEENQEVIVGLLPFFHAYGLYILLNSSLTYGCKMVTLPQFTPETFIATHKKHKVRVYHLVPPILQFLAAHPMVKPEDLTHMRVAMCAAAPCPKEIAHALKAKAPNPVFFQEGYGMSETMFINFTPLTGPEKIGSCGPLLPNVKAKIVDNNTGKVLGPGEDGELCVKSPSLMLGYHERPEATAEIFTEDRWVRTGDTARYDEDGYFYIVDRIKELIKVKGSQVSPSELENVLLQHPGIADAGVVGVDDIRAGELPRAYVVKRIPELTEDEVISYLDDKVAPYKRLGGGVRFVEQLPKNTTGKLLRRDLKQWAARN
ncbi:probable 4-coumarate--CoA ligase 3 [Macrobrachium rosenbergii]|uniref:probable 4-coumarate--CoA ligase 3 n=1 Tax=Macrobrachium rosenbergii TaxID=79674 RepID=UPI0034D41204